MPGRTGGRTGCAPQVTELYAQLEKSAPGRLVTGLGGPQTPRPLPALGAFLDQLDQAGPGPIQVARSLAGLLPGHR